MLGFLIGGFILKSFYSIYVFYGMSTIQYSQIIISSSIFIIFTFYYFISKNSIRTRNEILEQERIKLLASEKEILQTNLRLLQAQIEPHFLFNTLSNILSLIATEPAKGTAMLVDLTKYLRTSLSRTISETTTLDQELEMIEAYLNIQKIRMGKRLRFSIDIPAALRQHQLPPLLLQPIVENAVKHGLEPKVDGGEILIKASEENNILKIEIIDTGLGFCDLNKTGVGIRNVRERIVLLFGERGRLKISENIPYGVKAIIEVPANDI